MNNLKIQDRLAADAQSLTELKAAAKKNTPEAIKASAKQFEALFINIMVKSMRQAGVQDGGFDNEQTKMYTSMLDQQFSQKLADKGTGLADMLIKQMIRQQTDQTIDERVPNAVDRNTQAKINSYLDNAKVSLKDSINPNAPDHVQHFQKKLAEHAEKASKETGIPAKFMLGQAALESGWGRREIKTATGEPSHNVFGIKAGKGWTGKTVSALTTEYINGVPHQKVEKFRAYDNYSDAFKDYAKLLTNNPRYSNVIENANDLKSFATGLQRAGYATDPKYAEKITNIVNRSFVA